MIELALNYPKPEHDPFDRCACGHTRRAHYRSYDDGTGQGGCAGWSRGIEGICLCDEFELWKEAPPAAVEVPPLPHGPTVEGLDVHRWRLRALNAEQKRSDAENVLYQFRARVLNLLEEQIAQATLLRDEILKETRE